MAMVRRGLAGSLAFLALVGLSGCGGGGGTPSQPSPAAPAAPPAPTVTGVPPGTPAGGVPTGPGPGDPAPEPSISYAPGAGPPSGARTGGGAPQPTPAPSGVPAPTAAGPLDEAALPRAIAGYTGVPGKPTEGEFNPNGTWVHATDPAVASFQALPMCGTERETPKATYALAGSYAGPGDAPGNGLVLQFADAQAAQGWYAAFIERAAACPPDNAPVTVTDLNRGDGSFTARRHIGYARTTWSEAGRVKGDRVLLIALGGTPDLRQLGTELQRF
ncbi:hypothetical protein CGZ97_04650 [Enemella evansiae]|nr:hypothetical protein CGZ97_04650 [Enemella evansiae]